MPKTTNISPKNKEYFKKLIPFAQKIIAICKENKSEPIIYGSFSHFFHTKDKNMKVNDIDIILPKKAFKKILNSLKKNNINFKYYPEWQTIIIKKGKLRVEIDGVGSGYKSISEQSLSKNIFKKIDFYGTEVKIITLKQLEEIYSVAYSRSKEDKTKIMEKIKQLEKYLDRKIKI